MAAVPFSVHIADWQSSAKCVCSHHSRVGRHTTLVVNMLRLSLSNLQHCCMRGMSPIVSCSVPVLHEYCVRHVPPPVQSVTVLHKHCSSLSHSCSRTVPAGFLSCSSTASSCHTCLVSQRAFCTVLVSYAVYTRPLFSSLPSLLSPARTQLHSASQVKGIGETGQPPDQ